MAICLVLLAGVRVLGGENATAAATVAAGYVTGITVTSGGSGYVTEPAVTITDGGGIGATARAMLDGDKVGLVVVLTAGSGYTEAPTVTIDAPPKQPGLVLEMVPKLTVEGTVGSFARVEWAPDMAGPWTVWTNVAVGKEGTVLVDLTPGIGHRFYRTLADPRPMGPPGFVWIPAGTFVMGSPWVEAWRNEDEVQHPVTLSRGFWMSDHEVTQWEYESVVGNNPSHLKGNTNRPVEQVNWNDAMFYCNALTYRERLAGRITEHQAYRLPTEAEWEFAARAGTTGPQYGELNSIAWWAGNSGGLPQTVMQKAPNAWGLFDMIGNVWEWCADWYGPYPTESVTDPRGPELGPFRVARGGSWLGETRHSRSAGRGQVDPYYKDNNLGFRVVLSFAP